MRGSAIPDGRKRGRETHGHDRGDDGQPRKVLDEARDADADERGPDRQAEHQVSRRKADRQVVVGAREHHQDRNRRQREEREHGERGAFLEHDEEADERETEEHERQDAFPAGERLERVAELARGEVRRRHASPRRGADPEPFSEP